MLSLLLPTCTAPQCNYELRAKERTHIPYFFMRSNRIVTASSFTTGFPSSIRKRSYA